MGSVIEGIPVTLCEDPAQAVLVGELVTDWLDETLYYCVQIPAGVNWVSIDVAGERGDGILHPGEVLMEHVTLNVVYGSMSGFSSPPGYQWQSNNPGTAPQSVDINAPTVGTYYIQLAYDTASTDFDLQVTTG